MKKPGRPKMSIEQHLGKDSYISRMSKELNRDYSPSVAEKIPIGQPTYEEAKRVLVDVYETIGPTEALYCIRNFKVQSLSTMRPYDYPDFISLCKEKLVQYRAKTKV